ncbi:MAG TPA: c-type cytochrome [Chitinophagaceae bacterium]|nr:c-type cytochrome [Chitinophagaceae bacterium]
MIDKKIITLMVLGLLVLAGVAWVANPDDRHKNLKVLPKDIPDAMLDSIMKSYTVSLGVDCSFCHSAMKDMPDSLDYAADGNEMKENALKMMRMTIEINKSNFNYDKTIRPEYLNVITCMICHRGEAYPLH